MMNHDMLFDMVTYSSLILAMGSAIGFIISTLYFKNDFGVSLYMAILAWTITTLVAIMMSPIIFTILNTTGN